MTAAVTLIIFAGAFLGGFISGLAGFGSGLVALGIWLHVIPPAPASSLVIVCAVIAQAQTIHSIWHAIDFRRIWPMLAAGIIGVPLGSALLGHVDANTFRLGVGIVLIAFSVTLLFGRTTTTISWGGRKADAVIGLGGGILAGLAGLSGPLPTMWATLRGWSKDQRRGVFQAFNLTILLAALIAHTAQGLITRHVGILLLSAIPGTLVGAWIGNRTYHRLSDRNFHHVVLTLLGISGITLIWSAIFGR